MVPDTQQRTRYVFIGLAVIFLLALGLRWLHIQESQKDILYRYPVLDEELYYRNAETLARTGHLPLPHWRPPGLTYALAFLIRAFGSGAEAPRLAQALLGAGGCVLVYVLARRVLSSGWALAAAALLAIHGVAVEAAFELKSATWELVLNLLGLLLVLDASRRRNIGLVLVAGVCIGLSALFRPVILAFVPVAVLWLALGNRGRERWAMCGFLVLGVALTVTPVVMQNNTSSKTPVFISTNGGMNFFIGSNPDYEHTFTARPGNQWNRWILGPAQKAGFPQTGPEQDRFFYRAGLNFIGHHPAEAIGLWLRKGYLFWNGHEISRDSDVYLERESSPVLRALISSSWPYVPNGLLLPVALVGLFAERRRRDIQLLGLYLLVNMFLFAMYFPASRYRVASIPVLIVLAVVGAAWLVQRMRNLSGWNRRLLTTGCLLAIILLNVPTFETRQDLRAERFYFRGNALVQSGRHDEAFATYMLAAQRDSTDARPWLGMEAIHAKGGHWAEAAEAMRHVIAIGPYSSRDRDRLVNLLITLRDYSGAIRELKADMALMRDVPERRAAIQFTLGTTYYRMTAFDSSLVAFRSSSKDGESAFQQRVLTWARPVILSEKANVLNEPMRGQFWLELGRALAPSPAAILSLRHAVDLLGDHPRLLDEAAEELRRIEGSR